MRRTRNSLGSVLDFLMMDDAWVVALWDKGLSTKSRCRRVMLPGGDRACIGPDRIDYAGNTCPQF